LTLRDGSKIEKDFVVLADGSQVLNQILPHYPLAWKVRGNLQCHELLQCRFGTEVTGEDCSLQKSGRFRFPMPHSLRQDPGR
jgi:hypothetical protein